MTKEEILALIVKNIEGQGNQLDASSVLPKILRGIISLTSGSFERVELAHSGNVITRIGDTTPLTYDEIVALVEDKNNFVTLFDSDGEFLLPQYYDGGAIIFTGLNIFSTGSYGHRIAINVDNEIKAEYYELAQVAQLGDLADLETDHKSNLVEAINEVFDALETEELVVSMMQSNAERKVIYDLVKMHFHLAKNIVFVNTDGYYYKVNAYRWENDLLMLQTIMADGTLRSVRVSVSSTGSIAIV